MPTTKPRLIVTLEAPLHRRVEKVADRNGWSLSRAAHELIREAVEDVEEWGAVRMARERLRTLPNRKLLSHEAFWKKAGL